MVKVKLVFFSFTTNLFFSFFLCFAGETETENSTYDKNNFPSLALTHEKRERSSRWWKLRIDFSELKDYEFQFLFWIF